MHGHGVEGKLPGFLCQTLSAEAAQAEAAAQQNYEARLLLGGAILPHSCLQAFAAETADAVKLKREGIRKLNDKHAKQEI